MKHSMAAGFCVLRNNNNYCTHHKLSSKSANASAAGYFDTLDKKLFREKSSTEKYSYLLLVCTIPSAPALSAVFHSYKCAGPGLKVFCSVTQERTFLSKSLMKVKKAK
jgi:hypothetical protein